MKDSDLQPEKIFSEVTKASLEHAGISLTCQKDDYFFHCFVSINHSSYRGILYGGSW